MISRNASKNSLLFSSGQSARFMFKQDLDAILTEHVFKTSNTDELNLKNFRSDEFLKSHDGLHVLFSGCSVTYGDGLKKEEIWTSKLIEKIESSGIIVSGNYNLGISGTNIFSIVYQIFQYIRTVSRPDVIFINLPDINRFYTYDSSINKIKFSRYSVHKPKDYDEELFVVLQKHIHDYLFLLDTLCGLLEIKLFIFTWANQESIENLEIDSFINIDIKERDEEIFRISQIEDSPYSITARDGEHFGSAYHTFWAEKMFLAYKNTEEK